MRARLRPDDMRIAPGNLQDPRILALLTTHLKQCRAETAFGSAHALDVTGLKDADISFFAGWDGEELVAIGALKRLADGRGEIKSMHTSVARRRSGAGGRMLTHLLDAARAYNLRRVSLETGSWDFFLPARQLYRQHGFRDCPAFAPYRPDPHSVFLTLDMGDVPAVETRAAEPADLPAILAIYNDVLLTSTAIYRDEPATLAERTSWFEARRAAGFPFLVAARGDEVLGFASYGDWRGAFPGYRYTVEHSVHVARAARGAGAGAALMQHLMDLARGAGLHVMLGAVDADNAASLRFHEQLGFTPVANFPQVGRKFGRWLDLVFVQRTFAQAPG